MGKHTCKARSTRLITKHIVKSQNSENTCKHVQSEKIERRERREKYIERRGGKSYTTRKKWAWGWITHPARRGRRCTALGRVTDQLKEERG